MKKIILAFVAIIMMNMANAQAGKNQIEIGFDGSFPIGDFKKVASVGLGGYLKYLHGIGPSGQISLASGYQYIIGKDLKDANGTVIEPAGKYSIIPVLLGYRHNFNGGYRHKDGCVFVEPQIGYGSYGYKPRNGSSTSDGSFTWAFAVGHSIKKGSVSAYYQSGSKNGATTSFIGIHVGYLISVSRFD